MKRLTIVLTALFLLALPSMAQAAKMKSSPPTQRRDATVQVLFPMEVIDSGSLSLAAGVSDSTTYSDTYFHEVMLCAEGGTIRHSIDGDTAIQVDLPTFDQECFIDNYFQTQTWSVVADSSNGGSVTVNYRIRRYDSEGEN